MKTSEVIEAAQRFSKPYRVTNGKKFRLSDIDPGDTGELTSEDKPRAKEALQTGVQALAELQDALYAQDRWSVLIIFQAMDAAGKDGAIKHVMSGVNPQRDDPRDGYGGFAVVCSAGEPQMVHACDRRVGGDRRSCLVGSSLPKGQRR
jgi:hypothetical protein